MCLDVSGIPRTRRISRRAKGRTCGGGRAQSERRAYGLVCLDVSGIPHTRRISRRAKRRTCGGGRAQSERRAKPGGGLKRQTRANCWIRRDCKGEGGGGADEGVVRECVRRGVGGW